MKQSPCTLLLVSDHPKPGLVGHPGGLALGTAFGFLVPVRAVPAEDVSG